MHHDRWFGCPRPLQGRQHASEDLEPQVLLVAQAVGAPLDDPDLVVEPLDEAERDLVLGSAVGGDAIPMTVDHGGELLIRRQPLPLQAGAPVLEEASSPALALVAPQLAEALLQQIGRVEPLVGRQQRLQRPLAVEREILPARQQGVFLPLDVAPVAAGKPRVLALADRIQGLAQMAYDMELVEQNRGLRRMRIGRQAERFPHVHHRKADARALLGAEPGVEPLHARLRAVTTAEPDRPATQQVADHDPVGVPLADRDLVDPDHLRAGPARARQLGLHVLHLQRLDRVPVECQLLRHVRNRRLPAAPPDKIGEAPGVERIFRQKVEPVPLHLAAAAAIDTPHLQLQEYPRVSTGQIAHTTDLAVVPPRLHPATASARCFFERRRSVITRAFGSPKIPRTLGSARKPANEYVSQSRRWRFDARAIHYKCRIPGPAEMQTLPAIPSFLAFSTQKSPTRFHEDPNLFMGTSKNSCRQVLANLTRAGRTTDKRGVAPLP